MDMRALNLNLTKMSFLNGFENRTGIDQKVEPGTSLFIGSVSMH